MFAERGCCVVEQDLVARVSRYCLRTSAIPTMSDHEEDFGDVPSEYKIESKESMVGSYDEDTTSDFTTGSGITTKIPPLFDGSTFWFKYGKLIEDLLDLKVLEETWTCTEDSTCRRRRNAHRTS